MAETLGVEGRYDYVIIGAGTAGCVLANRLTEDPATRVLLIEAGGSDNYHWVHIPVGYLYCIGTLSHLRSENTRVRGNEFVLRGLDCLLPFGECRVSEGSKRAP